MRAASSGSFVWACSAVSSAHATSKDSTDLRQRARRIAPLDRLPADGERREEPLRLGAGQGREGLVADGRHT